MKSVESVESARPPGSEATYVICGKSAYLWNLRETLLGQAESTVHMLNWAVRSVKFLGVEFDQSEDEEVAVPDTTHL